MIVGMTPLGENIEISVGDFATAGTAILAMRGAGKSWLNGVLAEQLALERIPFVIVDPEGEYWTLRVKFANLMIAGGEHADIPLDSELAGILGHIVVDEHLQLVLDLSDMRRYEQTEFLSRFLNELFVKETEARIPLWICFEEADIWVPQSSSPPCKTSVLDICQRGRKRGLGFALVSQRPATIDKTALSQAEFRFFKRFQQPHDLRAVKDYLGAYSNNVDILPSLSVEEALMYAPTISKSPIRIKVPERICPHGGATPDQLAKIKPSTTALDLRKKLEKMLGKKKRELDEIRKRDVVIEGLRKKIEELEETLGKVELANDVAEILTESGMRISQMFPEDKISIPQNTSKSILDSGVLIFPHEKEATILKGESIVFIGPVGINSKTGIIIGNNFADILLNRLEPEERVVFLTLKKKDKPTSVSEISDNITFSSKKTRRLFKQLQRKGLLKQVGRNWKGILYTTRFQ